MRRVEEQLQLGDIERRFGLVVKSHRIGEMDLKIAEIDRVDEMVYEVYPDAVTTHGDAPVWMITWPASFGLAEFLLQQRLAAGTRVLELGCGTAATGVALAMAEAEVVCTDYDPLAMVLARHNGRLNGCRSLAVRFFDWYEPDLEGTFDLVVGSEVVYFEKSFGPLLAILKRYTRSGGTVVLSDQHRPQMGAFLERSSREGFSWRQNRQMVYRPEVDMPVRITVLTRSTNGRYGQ